MGVTLRWEAGVDREEGGGWCQCYRVEVRGTTSGTGLSLSSQPFMTLAKEERVLSADPMCGSARAAPPLEQLHF